MQLKHSIIYKLLVPAVAALLILPGCTRHGSALPSSDEAGKLMSTGITEKYGAGFTVDNVRDRDHTGDGPLSGKTGYAADGTDPQSRSFNVIYDGKTGKVLDDYGKYAHEEEIFDMLDQQLSTCSYMELEYKEIVFQPTEDLWESDGSLDDYLKDSGVRLMIRTRINDTENDYAEDLAAFASALQERGMQYTFTVYQGTRCASIVWNIGDAGPDTEWFRNKLR